MFDYPRLSAFPSVAANAPSTLVTDQLRGRSVHALAFKRGGTAFTNAHLSNLHLRVDGKDIFNNISGSQLVDLNEYDGLPDVTNYTFFFFGDPTANTIRGKHLGNLDLSLYQSPLELVATIGAATDPTLEVVAITAPPKRAISNYSDAELFSFRHLRRTLIQPSAAVDKKGYGIGIGSRAGALIRKLAFFHSNLTKVEFKKQGFVKLDNLSIAEISAIQQQFARVPQAGLFCIDAVVDGNQGEAENTVRDDGSPWSLEVNLTTSAGDTIYAFADLFATMAHI